MITAYCIFIHFTHRFPGQIKPQDSDSTARKPTSEGKKITVHVPCVKWLDDLTRFWDEELWASLIYLWGISHWDARGNRFNSVLIKAAFGWAYGRDGLHILPLWFIPSFILVLYDLPEIPTSTNREETDGCVICAVLRRSCLHQRSIYIIVSMFFLSNRSRYSTTRVKNQMLLFLNMFLFPHWNNDSLKLWLSSTFSDISVSLCMRPPAIKAVGENWEQEKLWMLNFRPLWIWTCFTRRNTEGHGHRKGFTRTGYPMCSCLCTRVCDSARVQRRAELYTVGVVTEGWRSG